MTVFARAFYIARQTAALMSWQAFHRRRLAYWSLGIVPGYRHYLTSKETPYER